MTQQQAKKSPQELITDYQNSLNKVNASIVELSTRRKNLKQEAVILGALIAQMGQVNITPPVDAAAKTPAPKKTTAAKK